MSWWGEPQMKRKLMPAKGKKAMPPAKKLFGAGPKKPENDDKPGKAQAMTRAALRKRLDGRSL